MTIKEAIERCKATSTMYEKSAEFYKDSKEFADLISCSVKYKQIAEWLNDLITSSYLLGEAVNEMYKGTSCNPTAWLEKYGETASELIRRIDGDKD